MEVYSPLSEAPASLATFKVTVIKELFIAFKAPVIFSEFLFVKRVISIFIISFGS